MERIKEAVEIAKAARGRLGEALPRETRSRRPEGPGASKTGFVPGGGELSHLDSKHLKAMRIVADDVADPRSRSFEMLRSQVFRKMSEADHQTLGITSPSAGCGKTVCTLNLALSIARLPERTVTLVDLDLRKPQIAGYLGLADGPGVDDVLRGRAPLEDIVVVPEVGRGRFRILPTFHASRNAAELIASSRMAELVGLLRAQDPSGIILFDLPPVLAVDDVISFLPQLDSVLLVVASGQTTVSDIMNSERLMGATEMIGILLNKSEEGAEAGYTY
ncbi:MAG: CpsD/CapB family tyrosine-protein kinase [Hyphomicrobiales bacterium]|nr:CpsD/CapB family tyrosine-protein kinase [Hyphomicrobiales bacterium]